MSDRYVPHAVTGEPVRVLTPKEQAAQHVEGEQNPRVYISAVRCWCGLEMNLKRDSFWIWSGDQVSISCPRGHTNVVRFTPETVT